MCLACEQEDLYFLYLERLEQARKAARGEQAPPNPSWMWPGTPEASAATAPSPRPEVKAAFVCDTPE